MDGFQFDMKLGDYVRLLKTMGILCGAPFGSSRFDDCWATFVKEHPMEWRKPHDAFVNAQIELKLAFLQQLAKQPGGKAKTREMYGITNMNAYKKLLG